MKLKEMIKTYLIGLFVLFVAIQPYYFSKYININSNNGVVVYIWGCLLEMILIMTILSPYIIGIRIQEIYNETK